MVTGPGGVRGDLGLGGGMVKRAAGKGFHGERDEERTCSFMQNSHTHSITVPRSPSTITFPSIVSFLKKTKP
jgi:hypothetical protein